MTLSPMGRQDLPQVMALLRSLLPFPVSDAYAEETLVLEDPDRCFLVAREGETVLGTVSVLCSRTLSGRFAVMEDVVVAENCRGRGIGTALLEAADSFARSRGCGYAIVVSSGFRKDAHRFYEKQGYTEDVRGFRKGYEE